MMQYLTSLLICPDYDTTRYSMFYVCRRADSLWTQSTAWNQQK